MKIHLKVTHETHSYTENGGYLEHTAGRILDTDTDTIEMMKRHLDKHKNFPGKKGISIMFQPLDKASMDL